MRRDTWVIGDAPDVASRCNIGDPTLRIVVLSFPARSPARSTVRSMAMLIHPHGSAWLTAMGDSEHVENHGDGDSEQVERHAFA